MNDGIGKLDLTLDSDMEDTSEIMGLEEAKDVEKENREYEPLIAHIKGEYNRAKIKRRADEERWLDSWRNYRGFYGPDVRFTDTEKSQAFIKITKTKVLAAYAQIVDILFSTAKFPIGVQPSLIVDGIAESVHFDPEDPDSKKEMKEQAQKYRGKPPVARQELLPLLGSYQDTLSRLPEDVEIKEGPGKTPTSATFEPAKTAAYEMEKQIHDQLEEANASKALRSLVFEMSLFGTGVFKGPFARSKEYPKWEKDGSYKPLIKTLADTSYVSIWDAYPDADAHNMEDAELFIQRHRMNKTQLRALKKRPYFRKESIEKAIDCGVAYTPEHWEHFLHDSEDMGQINRFEVLEYWGIIDKDIAEIAELDIPKEYKDYDQVQINAWICNGYLLRLVLNPFTPSRIPYFICPYELNPYSIFGVGVAENMTDTQLLMNGFMRLGVDNAVLSSNVVFEVNENNLVPGQDLKLYPGKVFRTNGQIGQSIHAMNIPNVTQQAMMMFDKARQLADEATGMPSYSHGQAGVTGVGRTASGMSMLMGAAKENIKAVVRNIDDYLLVPLGKSMFAFNMQFHFNEKFIGDLEIVAKGTESLMRNEIRSQKLLQFYQLTGNPMDAPFTKRDYILRELAASLDLDPDKTVNDPREAAIQATILKEIQQAMGIDPNAQGGGQSGAPQGMTDPTQQGGQAVPGAAPEPGAAGFTGGGGGANSTPPAPGGQPQ